VDKPRSSNPRIEIVTTPAPPEILEQQIAVIADLYRATKKAKES
jgi:hypothetical protein